MNAAYRAPTQSILGYAVSNLTMAEATEVIDSFIAGGHPHQITVINANKIYLADKYAELQRIIDSSAMVIPEEAMVIAGRLLKTPLKGRVSGVELMQHLLEISETKKYRVFLLGARPDIVSRLSQLCQTRYRCHMVGFADGYFSDDEEPALIRRVRQLQPDILFVALGSPRQEFWIHRHLEALNVPVCLGVGGSFDLIVGDKKRAPGWMQHGLEWVYRLMQEPRLFKRYLVTNSAFLYKILCHKLRIQQNRRG